MTTTQLTRRAMLAALGVMGAVPAWALDAAAELGAGPGAGPGELTGVRRPPRRPPPTPDQLIADARLGGQVAYAAQDAAAGLRADRDADLALPPASTLKIVTALYAMDRLGADHRFATRAMLDGQTLILAGGGDPALDTDALDRLAADTVAALDGRPVTRLVVWGGALPRLDQILAGQAVHVPYNPAVSGMMLNFNRVHLDWRRGGAGYKLSLTARGRALAPRAYTVGITTADRAAPLFTLDASGDVERWSVAARAMGGAGSRWLPVRHPELYAGDVFQTLCRAHGLPLPAPEVATDAPAGETLARQDSPPLREILVGLLKYSTNLTAEAVGLAASGAPDLRASGAMMATWLRGQGIDAPFVFADHSGLSPDSRISPRTMVRVLDGPGRAAGLAPMLKLDPLKGFAPGDDTVRAKTGTLNFVSNLAGYAGDVAFAVMTADMDRRARTEGMDLPQGVIGWTTRSKQLQDGLIRGFVRPVPTVILPTADLVAGPDAI